VPTIPLREDELQRPRDRKGGNTSEVTKGELLPVSIPKADPNWHPIAKRIFNSLAKSGQAHWYQQSDWAVAFSIIDDLSRYKKQEDRADQMTERREAWEAMTPQERTDAGLSADNPPPWGGKGGSAIKLQTAMNALGSLMVTEGDRRRMRLELQEPAEETTSAGVTALNKYRAALSK
jgi:hypothetical protein